MKTEIIYGPPGTGKTTDLLSRMAKDVESGLKRDKLGFVSFTRAAASEASSRLGLTNSRTIRTIHSFAYSLTSAIKEQMMDRTKYDHFGEMYGYEFTGGIVDGVSQGLSKGDEMLATHDLAMARMVEPMVVYEQTHPDYTPQEFDHFIKSYAAYRSAYGFMDFNDLIKRSLEQNINLGVEVLYVDEAQDLSPLQWAFIKNASKNVKRLVIAGDDDQCIYAWAGADSDGMRQFHDFGNVHILSQSHRVPRSVHALAQHVITNIKNRVEKIYAPDPRDGEVNYYNELDRVDVDPSSVESMLVLYRNHSSRKEIENWLMDNGVRFSSSSQFGSPFTDRFANAVRVVQRIEADESISIPNLQTLTKVACHQYRSRIEARDFKLIKRLGWRGLLNMPHRNEEYLTKVQDRMFEPAKCLLSTIHSAKGMEADRVVLFNSMGQRTWEGFNDDEHRVWYVAVTRAKNKLEIVNGDNQYDLEV